MQIASVLAGYSLGEADILRRAMGKKKKEVMDAERAALRRARRARAGSTRPTAREGLRADGALRRLRLQQVALGGLRARGLPDRLAQGALPGALHGRAADHGKGQHGQARAVHRRVPRDGHRGAAAGRQRARASTSRSRASAIRFGLSAIKNVGEAAIRSILEARGARGRVRARCTSCARRSTCAWSTSACSRRWCSPGRSTRCGARRSQLVAAIDAALEHGQKRRADREAGQASLFGARRRRRPTRAARAARPAGLGREDAARPREGDARLLRHRPSARGLPRAAADVRHAHVGRRCASVESGTEVAVGRDHRRACGAASRRRASGGPRCRSRTWTGQVEVLVFPKAYAPCQALLEDGPRRAGQRPARERRGPPARSMADTVCPLDELRERRADAVQLRLDAADLDDELWSSGLREPGRGPSRARRGCSSRSPGRAPTAWSRWRESACRVAPSRQLHPRARGAPRPDRVRYRAGRRRPRSRAAGPGSLDG